jgi:hypothetical protein
MGETRRLELQLNDRPPPFFPRDLRASFAPFAVKSFSAAHLCETYIPIRSQRNPSTGRNIVLA